MAHLDFPLNIVRHMIGLYNKRKRTLELLPSTSVYALHIVPKGAAVVDDDDVRAGVACT